MKNQTHQTKLCGFSLVEMSVVIAIIGFIAGGILAGLNLKHTAELRRITSEITQFSDGAKLFKDRYLTLPGDYYDATNIWGTLDSDVDNCKTTASTDSKTCNGDGNGWVGTPGDTDTYYESHRFWQHMANESLITGAFSGARTATIDNTVTCSGATNCPSASLSGGLYYAATVNDDLDYFSDSNGISGVDMFDGNKRNVFVLFKSTPVASGSFVGAPILTPEEASSLDIKMDDGKPATGTIQTFEPDGGSSVLSTQCASSTDESSAIYMIGLSSIECALIFTNAF